MLLFYNHHVTIIYKQYLSTSNKHLSLGIQRILKVWRNQTDTYIAINIRLIIITLISFKWQHQKVINRYSIENSFTQTNYILNLFQNQGQLYSS